MLKFKGCQHTAQKSENYLKNLRENITLTLILNGRLLNEIDTERFALNNSL